MHDMIEAGRPRRAVPVAVQLPGTEDGHLRRSPDELGRLAPTLGVIVVGELTQRRDRLGWDQQARKAEIFERCLVLEEKYDEHGVVLRLEAPPDMIPASETSSVPS
jgi:hypothetical protein